MNNKKFLPVMFLLLSVQLHAQETPPGPPFFQPAPEFTQNAKADTAFRLENNLRDTYYIVTQNNQDIYLAKEQWEQRQGSKEWLSISMYNYRNKLFVGVYNPVTLHYNNPDCENTVLKVKNASGMETGKNQFRIIVGNEKQVEITAYGKMKNGTLQKLGTQTFEVVQLPDRIRRAILADAGLPLEKPGEELVPDPEVRPKYKEDLEQMMATALRYPARALQKGIKGLVTVKFIINTGGFVKDVELDPSSPIKDTPLVEELKRLLYLSSGRWFPAWNKGHLVSTTYTVTAEFTIENGIAGITLR